MENYEQKYKDALERARILHNQHNSKDADRDIECIFPELKESEDKKTIKSLIAHLKECRNQTRSEVMLGEYAKWIAWLEKKGEQNHCNGEVNDEALQQQLQIWFDKGKCSGRDEVIFHPENFGLQKQGEQKSIEWNADDLLKRNQIIDILQEYNRTELISWLEKQGEQKPVDNQFTPEQANVLDKHIDKFLEQKSDWSEEDEPQKELAETYLAVFDKKFPILPTLKGKKLADYKNFLNKCQQILGLKYWSIRPLQAKLFEKLSLLWAAWGAEHLKGLGQTNEDTDNKNHAWSEEDEETLDYIIAYIEKNKSKDTIYTKKTEVLEGMVAWLKSLKERMKGE